MKKAGFAVMMLALGLSMVPVMAQDALTLTPIGRYETGIVDGAASEISAYHAPSQTVFVTNGADATLDLLDISDPTNPTLKLEIDLDALGGTANSVAVNGDLVAVSIDGEESTDPGTVIFFNPEGDVLATVPVGAIPDMVTFTPDGSKLLVANEGEPSSDYTIDPEGSVSIIDLSAGVEALSEESVTTVSFTAFNDAELDESVRVFGPGATPAMDFEPEYIAISPDGGTAYVTLQENNAVAVIDIEAAEAVAVVGLGFKDHSQDDNGMDASNEDGAINISTWPTLGMYMPDAIVATEINGETYLFTANEGDAREYDAYEEEARVADLVLDEAAFPNAAELQAENQLGRLKTTTASGDTDGDGDFDVIYSFGARSFSIWDAEGSQVWDSGDQIEQIIAERLPEVFNSQGLAESFDDRSDDKGPEPEGIEVATIGDQTYVFVGLERASMVMVYNVTDPNAPEFVTVAYNSDWQGSYEDASFTGDISPEGLKFISAEDSPNGMPLLVVTHEVSGTTTIYTIE